MQIFKFGGASIKNPDALNNIHNIISNQNDLVVVVSAIDKTTNKLESLVDAYLNKSSKAFEILKKIKHFHLNFAEKALNKHFIKTEESILSIFQDIEDYISKTNNEEYDKIYDNIVSSGELLSSLILSEFLNYKGVDNQLIDIRTHIITDSNNRDAKVLWTESEPRIKKAFSTDSIYVTQGFIGRDKNGVNTTLGREGSDYTASALAYLLDAKSVTIWKDVPGIMNADPSWCSFAEKIDFLSFRETIELAFYGAKIIHPKTIKPIENKGITLYVKPFLNPTDAGTEVAKLDYKLKLIPIYILKYNQILISISPKDFSFVVEENISKIFGLFSKYKIKVNITQNSAISFSASIDGNNRNLDQLIKDLKEEYFVKYNTGLELVTIRYYNAASIKRMTENRKILVMQKSRTTARFVMF